MSRKGCIPIKANSGKNVCRFKEKDVKDLCLGFSSKIIEFATGALTGKHLIKKEPRQICKMVTDAKQISKDTFNSHCNLPKCVTREVNNNPHRFKFFKGKKGNKKVYWYVYSQNALKGC